MVTFHCFGPATSDGALPISHGLVVSSPQSARDGAYKVEMPDGVVVDLHPNEAFDPTDFDDELPPTMNFDPASGDPVHPWRPPWMKPGQAVTYHRNGQRQLGHLQLTDSFQWCFAQHDDRGRRVTEIELPDLSTSWKELLDDDVLEIGHSSSPWAPSTTADSQPHDTLESLAETLAAPVQRNTLRSGRHFRGHARHVSAKGLQGKTPQFLWQSMRMPKDGSDYKIWLDSYKEEHDGLRELDTYEVIDQAELDRLRGLHDIEVIPTMCIHTVKPDSQGLPDRAKSRIVVLGNEQRVFNPRSCERLDSQ